jgi:hypothetical protein
LIKESPAVPSRFAGFTIMYPLLFVSR